MTISEATTRSDAERMKICCDCEVPKPLSDFRRDSRHPDGLRRYCRSCGKRRERVGFLGATMASSQPKKQVVDRPRPKWGWQDAAECRGEDLVLFFGPDGERQPERDIRERKAKWVCMGCPVLETCLDYALAAGESGVWGGLNDDERRAEQKRRNRRRAA